MKKRSIKKKPFIFLILFIFVAAIGGTFAYYSSQTAFENKFKTMTYNVTIEEEFNNTWGTKKVSFVNNEETNAPVVLRIYYDEVWSKDVNGTLLTLNNTIDGTNVVNKNWTNSFTNDFVKGSDGWYYYKKILSAEQSVQVLESIALNNELIQTSPYKNDYKTYNYELSFNFESIQANTNAISEIWNKTATISGSDVTWAL